MKKIILFGFTIFCLVPTICFAQAGNQSAELFSLLNGVNENWKYFSKDDTLFRHVKYPEGKAELIATHLSLVISILEKTDIQNFSEVQISNRLALLAKLKEYTKSGIFPENIYKPGRIPVFIDHNNILCAVAFLMMESGEKYLAKSLQKKYNLFLLRDMEDDRIATWANLYGFQPSELAFIQPTYEYQYPIVEKPAALPLIYMRNSVEENRVFDRIEILAGSYFREPIFSGVKPVFASDALGQVYHSFDSKKENFNRSWLATNYNFEATAQKPIFNYFYRHPAYLYSVKTDNFLLSVNPILHFEVGAESATKSQTNYINTRGVEVAGSIGDKVGFFSFIGENQGNYMSYIDEIVGKQKNVFPGEGRTKPFKKNGVDYMAANGYVVVQPMKEIRLQFGHGRNFIGNGYRSLILSDFAKDYLFLKINTRVWKINYQNLFTEFIDHRNNNFSEGLMPRKYGAFHHLSINPVRNLEIGVFEGVVFGHTDTTASRAFELQYLNPIIFYRAVEFHIGSPDNVLIGLNWKYNFLRHFQFYGQIMFDEFKYWEIVRNTGWWANKYGIQGGLKYFDVLDISGLDVQLEYNQVRPYTYSHDNPSNSYTHYAQPLAHPMGANLKEWVVVVNYQPISRLNVNAKFINSHFGSDSSSINYGGNILISNTPHPMEFDNKTGQGVTNKLSFLQCSASYMLLPNLFADFMIIRRSLDSELDENDRKSTYLGVALRLNIGRKDFAF